MVVKLNLMPRLPGWILSVFLFDAASIAAHLYLQKPISLAWQTFLRLTTRLDHNLQYIATCFLGLLSDAMQYKRVQVIDDFSGRSFRLLALAKGWLRGVSQEALTHMTQEQLEQQVGRFELLGLLVLSNHLRSDSRDTITQLQQQ